MSERHCWKIFYSKDVNKKKKVYCEGVLVQLGSQVKIYDEEGKQLLSFKNSDPIQEEEEYTANRNYLSTNPITQSLWIARSTSKTSRAARSLCLRPSSPFVRKLPSLLLSLTTSFKWSAGSQLKEPSTLN